MVINYASSSIIYNCGKVYSTGHLSFTRRREKYNLPAALFCRMTCLGPVSSSSDTDLAMTGLLKLEGAR